MKATVQFSDERVSSEEMLRTLNDPTFFRKPEMIRALVPACVSLQIPVKMGMKLVAQTAALFWSVDHVFCNFEVGTPPTIHPHTFPALFSLQGWCFPIPRGCSAWASRSLDMYSLVALFLSQWLRSIERDGTAGLTTDEARIVSLLRDLLFEADPDADAHEPMSALLLTVWADQFDGVNVWGSMSLHPFPFSPTHFTLVLIPVDFIPLF